MKTIPISHEKSKKLLEKIKFSKKVDPKRDQQAVSVKLRKKHSSMQAGISKDKIPLKDQGMKDTHKYNAALPDPNKKITNSKNIWLESKIISKNQI